MPEANPVKPGEQTTEYKVAKASGVWSVVGVILGIILATGAEALAAAGVTEDSTIGVIFAAVIAVAGIAKDALVKLGYIKSRTQVKAPK